MRLVFDDIVRDKLDEFYRVDCLRASVCNLSLKKDMSR